jgi:putative phage-type endonuclease
MPVTREQWLTERRNYLGATDTASILGKGFNTPFGVWLEKTGQPSPEPDENARRRMEVGIELEPFIARLFERETGKSLIEAETLRHPSHPFIGANIDRMTEDKAAVVELKTHGLSTLAEFGPEGSDQVPDRYHIQCTKQMGLARLNGYPVHTAFLYAYDLATHKTRLFVVPFDEEFFEFLIAKDVEFWTKHVEANVAPEVEAKDSDRLRLLYPEDDGEFVIADDEEDDLVARLMDLSPKRKEICDQFDSIKTRLIERIGSHAGITSIYGKVSYKASKPTESIDWEAVARELSPIIDPLIIARHTTMKPGSRRFNLPKEAN